MSKISSARQGPPSQESDRSSRRILVVDDNQDSAEMLAQALDLSGHVTRVAFDGPTALVAAQEFEPELALLDIGLPMMDGYEVARRLRQSMRADTLKLIAVTGYGDASERALAEEVGFDAHLVKPVALADLQRVVDTLLA